MIRCIAIDDEPLALRQIVGYIDKTSFLELAAACPSALEAAGEITRQQVDLMFVDINMPDLNGLDFVRTLTRAPLVIFTTAYSEYALEGFKVDAIDYLLKPISYTDFLRAAEKAYRQHQLLTGHTAKQDLLFVKSDYKTVQIDISSVTCIESFGEYVKIFSGGGKPVMTLGSLRSFEEKLPTDIFMRVHRSYIVNLKYIASVERGVIITPDGTRIPVGEQYKDAFHRFIDRNSLPG